MTYLGNMDKATTIPTFKKGDTLELGSLKGYQVYKATTDLIKKDNNLSITELIDKYFKIDTTYPITDTPRITDTTPIKDKGDENLNPKVLGNTGLKKIGYACSALREVVGLLNSGEYMEKVAIDLNYNSAQKDQNSINSSNRVFQTKVVNVNLTGNNNFTPLHMSGLKNPFGHMMGGRSVSGSLNIVTNDPDTIINLLSMFRSNSIYDIANNMISTARGLLAGKKAVVPDLAVTREALQSGSFDNYSKRTLQSFRVARRTMKSEQFIKFLEEQFKTQSKTGLIDDLYYDHPEPLVIYAPLYNSFGYKSFVPTTATIQTLEGSPGHVSIVLNVSWVDTRFVMKEALRFKKNVDAAYTDKAIAWYNTINKSAIEDLEDKINTASNETNMRNSIDEKYEERQKLKENAERNIKESITNTGTFYSTAPVLASYTLSRFKEYLEIKLGNISESRLKDNASEDEINKNLDDIIQEQIIKNNRLPGISSSISPYKVIGQAGVGLAIEGFSGFKAASKIAKGNILAGIALEIGGPLIGAVASEFFNSGSTSGSTLKEGDKLVIRDNRDNNDLNLIPLNFPLYFDEIVEYSNDSDAPRTAYFLNVNLAQLMGKEYLNFLMEIMDYYTDVAVLDSKIKSWAENSINLLSAPITHNANPTGFGDSYTAEELNGESSAKFYNLVTSISKNGISKTIRIVMLVSSELNNSIFRSESSSKKSDDDIKAAYSGLNKNLFEYSKGSDFKITKDPKSATDQLVKGILIKTNINAHGIISTINNTSMNTILLYFHNVALYDRQFYRAATFANITLNTLHELVVLLPALEENYLRISPILSEEKIYELQKLIATFRKLIGKNLKSFKKEDYTRIIKRAKTLVAYGNNYQRQVEEEHEINNCLFGLSKIIIQEFIKSGYHEKLSEYLNARSDSAREDTFYYNTFILPYNLPRFSFKLVDIMENVLSDFFQPVNMFVTLISVIALFFAGWIAFIIGAIAILISVVPFLMQTFSGYVIKKLGTSNGEFENIVKNLPTPLLGNSILLRMASEIYTDQMNYLPNEIFPPDIIPTDGMSNIQDIDTYLVIPLRHYADTKKTMHPGFWIWTQKDAKLTQLLDQAKTAMFINHANKLDSLFPQSNEDISALADASADQFQQMNLPGDQNNIFLFLKRIIGLTFITEIEKLVESYKKNIPDINCLNDKKLLTKLLEQTYINSNLIFNSLFTQGVGNTTQVKNAKLFGDAPTSGCINYTLIAQEYKTDNKKEKTEPIITPIKNTDKQVTGCLYFKFKINIKILYEEIMKYEPTPIKEDGINLVPINYYPSTKALITTIEKSSLIRNNLLPFITSSIRDLQPIGKEEDIETKMIKTWRDSNLIYDNGIVDKHTNGLTLADLVQKNNIGSGQEKTANSVAVKLRKEGFNFNGLVLYNMFKGDTTNEESIGRLISLKVNAKTAAREIAKRNISKKSLSNIRLQRQFLQTNNGAYGTQGLDLINNRFQEILDKETFNTYGEKASKMNPVFKLYFLQENKREWLMVDDYYSYSGIESFNIHQTTESPMYTAEVVLSNFTNNLGNLFADRVNRENPFFHSSDSSSQVNSIMLKPGCKLKIYLGYGTVLTEDDCVFCGKITDMQGDQIKKLICTSDGDLLLENYAEDNVVRMGYSYFALAGQKNIYSLQTHMLKKLLVNEFLKNSNDIASGRLSESGQIIGSSSFESDTFEPDFTSIIQSTIAGIGMETFFSFFNSVGLIDMAGLGRDQATQFIGGLKEKDANVSNISENIRVWNTPINETYFAAFNKNKASGTLKEDEGEIGALKNKIKTNILMESNGSITQWLLNVNKVINTNTFVDLGDKFLNWAKLTTVGEYKETDQWLAHNETYWDTIQEMLLQLPNHVCTVRPFDERNSIVLTDKVRGYYRFTRKVYSSEIQTNNVISQLSNRAGINIESIDIVMNNILRDDDDSVALFILFYIYAGRALNYLGSSSSGATFFTIPTENQVSFVVDRLNAMISDGFDPSKESIFGLKEQLKDVEKEIEDYKKGKWKSIGFIVKTVVTAGITDNVIGDYFSELEIKKRKIKTSIEILEKNNIDYTKNTKNENPTVVARRRLLATMFDESVASELNNINDDKFLETMIGSGKNFALIDNNVDAFTLSKDNSISNEIADTELSTASYNNYSAGCAIMEACGNIVTWAISNAYMRSSSHRKLSENHYKSNGSDIISNEINLSKAFNAVEMTLVEDPDDYEEIVLGNKEGSTNMFKTSSYLKNLNTYRTFIKNAYSSETINSKKANFSMGVNILANVLKETYSGQLVLLGDASIKEWDIITIFDQMNDMYGFFEVKDVTHIYNKHSGFITVVTPQLPTYNDYAINPGPTRSGWEYVGGFLKILALGSVIAYTGKKGIKHLKGAAKASYNALLGTNFVKSGVRSRVAAFGQRMGSKLPIGASAGYKALAHPVASLMNFLATNKFTTYAAEIIDSHYLKVKLSNIDESIKGFTKPIAEILDTANTKAVKENFTKLLENKQFDADQIAGIKQLQKDYDDHLISLQDTYMDASGIRSASIKEMETIRKFTKSDNFKNLPPEAKEKAVTDEIQRLWKNSIDNAPKDKKKILEALKEQDKGFRESQVSDLKKILNKKIKDKTKENLTPEQLDNIKKSDIEIDINNKIVHENKNKLNKDYDFEPDIEYRRNNNNETRTNKDEIIADIKKEAQEKIDNAYQNISNHKKVQADIKKEVETDETNAVNQMDEILEEFNPSKNEFTEELLKDISSANIEPPKLNLKDLTANEREELKNAVNGHLGNFDELYNGKKIETEDELIAFLNDEKWEQIGEQYYKKTIGTKSYIASEVLGLDPGAGVAKNTANAALTLVGFKGGSKGLAGTAAMWGIYSLFDGIIESSSSGFTGIVSEYYGQNAVTVSGLISKGEPFIANLDGMQKKNFKTTEFANPLEIGKARFRRGIEIIEEEIGEAWDSGGRQIADSFADNQTGLNIDNEIKRID